jgi:hypothetical protein
MTARIAGIGTSNGSGESPRLAASQTATLQLTSVRAHWPLAVRHQGPT